MLPAGFSAGHFTDLDAATGATVILAPPDGAVGAVEVRGGGPGTRETDLLAPAAPSRPITGVVFSGGSARGPASAGPAAPGAVAGRSAEAPRPSPRLGVMP